VIGYKVNMSRDNYRMVKGLKGIVSKYHNNNHLYLNIDASVLVNQSLNYY